MYLRCNQTGHVRGNCGYKTANTQSYASKLVRTQPEAVIDLNVEEDPGSLAHPEHGERDQGAS